MYRTTRRELLAASGALATFAATKSGLRTASAYYPPVRIRRDVGAMQPDDPVLVTYRKAIEEMHALPTTDRRGWRGQAEIHLDFCPHGNWFFLPWHRAYLSDFEEICRELAGDETFALPYWNWTIDPQVPATFWGATNPLDPDRWNDPDNQVPPGPPWRGIGPNDSANAFFVGEPVIQNILSETDFEQFASLKSSAPRPNQPPFGGTAELEGTPHNYIHGFVGGHMGAFLSPLDPIFWLHHCNIDRLWAEWNALGNANTTDPDWLDFEFVQDFVDRNGNAAPIKVSATEDTTALGYVYDTVPALVAQPAAARTLMTPVAERVLERYEATNNRPTRLLQSTGIAVATTAPVVPAGAMTLDSRTGTAAGRRVFAQLTDISPPETTAGFYVNVFVNCPYLSAETPTNDPHYATSFAFFGHPHGGPAFSVDITEPLTRLNRMGRPATDQIEVQLLPLPMPGRQLGDVEFTVGRVEIIVVEAT
jgi:tyrosinase